MAYIYSLADTWNDGATTFKGIALNVTDSASAAGSLLMDLQVGGVSKFSVRKDGRIAGEGASPSLVLSQTNGSVLSYGSNNVSLGVAATTITSPGGFQFAVQDSEVRLNSTFAFGWTSGNTGAANDLLIRRDAANTLAQRNGVNAQAFNLYNTYTDASNYERGFMKWSANQLNIGAEAAGTGTARNIAFFAGAGGVNMLLGNGITRFYSNPEGASDNTYDLGSTTRYWKNLFQKGYHEVVEMTAPAAPAANGVRIYAEDNGSGKTRIMALFATGAAVQIAIEP